MAEAKRDGNRIPTLLAVSNVDGITPVLLWADPITHRLLVDLPVGAGNVVGPASAIDGNIVIFDGNTGKLIKDSGAKLADYQTALGYTAENVANKSTSVSTDGSSDTKYPSVKAVKDYADGLVAGLLDYRGAYDASGNTFPATGGSGSAGAILKGDMWIISVAGTLGGTAVQIGDSVIANTDTPGQTAGNWNVLNGNISYVPEDVTNKVTSISGASTDTQYPSAKLLYDQLAGKVDKSTYDAHSVLYATTDNTPVALTVGEQTLVGRATGGNISAIAIDSDLSSVSVNDDTIPSAKATKAMGDLKLPLAGGTMTGNITLGENTSITLDPAGSADGKYSGITVTGVAGYSQAFGDLVTLDKDDSRWEAVDISAAAAATGDARGILGMVVSAGTDGNACTILLNGIIRADANFPTLTIGAPVYASTTGDIVVTQPTTTDYVIRIIGYGLTADEMYFNPGAVWTTHT